MHILSTWNFLVNMNAEWTFGNRNTTALPCLPIRAVRPTLCMNTFGSCGESYCQENIKNLENIVFKQIQVKSSSEDINGNLYWTSSKQRDKNYLVWAVCICLCQKAKCFNLTNWWSMLHEIGFDFLREFIPCAARGTYEYPENMPFKWFPQASV